MKVKFRDLESAFEFVSFDSFCENTALLDKSTGKIYWNSEEAGLNDIPEELWDSDSSVAIPHKNDLDLGKQLVLDFVRTHLPQHYDHVRDIFSRRGAYARFKDFLQYTDQLQKWYDFENTSTKKALREWAEENGVEIEDD